ncbi:hypothetical protein KIPB_004333 [Kipferlia bialata]|uniref:Uncharacterized protein n=1 Tax=Kipferlia bialata TaxID=797122 RepID=A0A391P1Y0_9EUKA|nr:hypothetical protein KIPB_004333 [Kipferlia bialata]|eukprot:g4333.t1
MEKGAFCIHGPITATRGVVFCPPADTTQLEIMTVLKGVLIYNNMKRPPTVVSTHVALSAFATLQHYATHGLPHLFAGCTAESILPRAVWEATPPALRVHYQTVAVMQLPAKAEAERDWDYSMGPISLEMLQNACNHVPDKCRGRTDNMHMDPSMQRIISLSLKNGQCHALYWAYSEAEVAEVAKEDQKRDWAKIVVQ